MADAAPPSTRRRVLGLCWLLAAAFHADKLLLGPWAWVRPHDVFDSDFFRYAQTGGLVARFGTFGWFPDLAGGMPSHAWHHTPYFPLALLSIVLPPWLIHHAMVIALMAAAGWGMYRLLHERLSVRHEAALASGLVFAVASQLQLNAIPETVFNYAFPLFYVWTADAWESRGRSAAASLLGACALLWLSYPVLTLPFYAPLHLAVIGLDDRLAGRRAPALARATAVWTGYALACAPVLCALWRYAPESARRYGAAPPGALSPAGLLADAARLAVGSSARALTLAPLAAAAAALNRDRGVRRALLLWLSLLAASVVVPPLCSVLAPGSVLEKADLSHLFWTLPTAAFLAVGAAAEALARRPGSRPLYAAAFAAATLSAFALRRVGAVSAPLLALLVAAAPALLLLLLGAARPRARLPAAAAAALLLSGFAAARAFRAKGDEPEARPYQAAYRDRSVLAGLRTRDPGPWRAGSAYGLYPEALAGYGFETVDGRGPLLNRRYKDFFRLIVAPQLEDRARADFFDTYWYDLYLDLTPEGRLPDLRVPLLELANVRWVFSSLEHPALASAAQEVIRGTSDSGEWARDRAAALARVSPRLASLLVRVFRPRPYNVYVLPAFPRGFVAGCARVLPDDPAVLERLGRADARELRGTALFSAADDDPEGGVRALAAAGCRRAASAASRIASYAPDRLEFEVSSPRAAALVVTDNFDPGWRAKMDGKDAPVRRADHAFQAVLFPAGSHRVVLEYRDDALPWTYLAAALGILAIAASALRAGSRDRAA